MRFLLLPFLLPAALIFLAISFLRSKLYDAGILDSHAVAAKVICIGNITSGGTGKTPLIRWLATELIKRGRRVAILSRGYKRSGRMILKVNPMSAEVDKFGDEPLQLARQLKNVGVYVGAARLSAAKKIVAEEKPDVILLDDGFQHRRLKRDIDFLVLDATQPKWHYWPLPLGFGREGRWAIERASAVVITKTNLSSGTEVQNLSGGKQTIQFDSELVRARTLDGEIWSFERLKGRKSAVLTAIGRPENFKMQIEQAGIEVVFHKFFPDHHQFRKWEVNSFVKRAEAKGADFILTTEKDAVKLAGFDFSKEKVLILELEINLTKGREHFDRIIGRIFS